MRLRAQLLGLQGRSRELTQCLMQLIRYRGFQLDDLVVLAGFDPFISDKSYFDSVRRATGDELLPLLAQACQELNANQPAAAEQHLAKLVAARPTFWEAQALLGEIYSDRPGGEFLRWHLALPADADADSRVWLARGLFLRNRDDLRPACRCFWEALKREPELLKATVHLGQTLLACGESDLGKPFLLRGKQMQQIVNAADQMGERPNWSRASALIDNLEATDRVWEAWAWCVLQADALPHDRDVAARRDRLSRRLSPDLPRTDPQSIPGRDFDWSPWTLPDWVKFDVEQVTAGSAGAPSEIRFVDEAQHSGLRFEYVSSGTAGTRGHYIFETTGGGVAALDFDGDGWIDLYFAQGGAWPVVAETAPRDALFRNQLGVRFDEITNSSGIVETGYSQGVAAGDYDNDGFPDLYVANIGCNRLFHNNGDGTFADITESAGLRDDAWTVSCAMADLNGDGFPDLFDVNYVQGAEVFTTLCHNARNEPLVCRPTVFEPALDRVAINLGNGMFKAMQKEAGLDVPEGRGLGLIVADFNDDRRLDVFVANDQGANHLLLNDQSGSNRPLKFREQAFSVGIAVDRDGLSKAGMGIAAGDINGDGRLDLFVTTFAQEYKVLYLSQPDGSYVDSTLAAGLREPTFAFLGFGTQFLDADLDGLHDLVVLNGHIDEFPGRGQSYEMRPQVFRGLPGPRFEELTAAQAGEFFTEKRLGRALATLDWNRDGLIDFVATHLEGPAALGTNKTQPAGNSLRLKLVGTAGSRDAIGARLRVTPVEGEEICAHLIAGDGYESSSERLIQVGLGARESVDRLEIDWPSGNISVFEHVACQTAWLAIEGESQLRPLKRDFP